MANLRNPLWSNGRRSRAELSFLDKAYEEGYRIVDTAEVYGLGASEKCLGRWMQMRRNRSQVVVISKGAHPRVWRPGKSRLTVECIAKDLASSLERMRTDYIDFYLLHRDADECDLSGIMQFLHEQTQQGTIHRLGVSNWHHERIQAANSLAQRLDLTPFSVSSPQLSLLTWSRPPWRGTVSLSGPDATAARAWHQQTQMPVLAWSPFGGGIAESPPGDWTPTGAGYNHPNNRQRLARAAVIARERGLSVAQILLAYLVSLPFPVHPIYSSRSIDHLRANREAMEVVLSGDEIRRLEAD